MGFEKEKSCGPCLRLFHLSYTEDVCATCWTCTFYGRTSVL